MDADRGGSRIDRLLAPLVALTFAASALVKIGDQDIFWHVVAGRYVLARGQIPHVDPFSYASRGPWRYTEAAAQVLYALVERAAGFAGLVWLNAALLLVLAWIVAACCSARGSVRAVVVGWVCAASYVATEPKPQTFSYLCFAGLVWALGDGRARTRRRYALPLLFFAWGYLHRAGTLGLMVLAGSALVALSLGPRRRGLELAAISVAATLALALNPGGLFYFTSTLDLAARASFHRYLSDWQPLTLAGLLRDHLLLVPLLAAALGERLRTRKLPDAELVALVVSLGVAASSARFVPFAAIAAAPPAARGLEALLAGLEQRTAVRPALWRALLSTLALGSLLGWVVPRVAPAFWGPGIIDSLVPVRLAEVIAGIPARGHLYHSFDFGGYFVYALSPARKVLIDGRNDTVYDDRFFVEVLRASVEEPVFAALDRRYHFEIAALRWQAPDDPSGLFLARDPRWALVSWDDRGAVYVLRSAVDASYLEQHAYRELRVDTAFARAATPPQSADAHDARFVSELARNTREAPHSARAWLLASLAYRTRGLGPAYQRARRQLVELVVARDLKLPIP